MYNKQCGKFFNYQHFTTIGTLIVVFLLITCCQSCPRRRSPSPTPPPAPTKKTQAPPKVPTTYPTFNPSGSAHSSPSSSATSSSSGIVTSSSSERPSSTSQPGENGIYCFSTTIKYITNEIINQKLNELATKDALKGLFTNDNMDKINVFLKGIKLNQTNCSRIQGFMIEIIRIGDDNYTSVINALNQSAAEKNCRDYPGDCTPFNDTAEPNTTQASSIQTEEHTTEKQLTKETSTKQNEGTIAPGKSDNNGLSSVTMIVVPVLVAVLVIVVITLIFWFKRRSTKKRYKDNQTQNSANHVAGPVNGDVYTIVNPNAETKKNEKSDSNDLVYTELSCMKSGNNANEIENPAEPSNQTEYADITHILKAEETTYENVKPEKDEKDTYANVVAFQ